MSRYFEPLSWKCLNALQQYVLVREVHQRVATQIDVQIGLRHRVGGEVEHLKGTSRSAVPSGVGADQICDDVHNPEYLTPSRLTSCIQLKSPHGTSSTDLNAQYRG